MAFGQPSRLVLGALATVAPYQAAPPVCIVNNLFCGAEDVLLSLTSKKGLLLEFTVKDDCQDEATCNCGAAASRWYVGGKPAPGYLSPDIRHIKRKGN